MMPLLITTETARFNRQQVTELNRLAERIKAKRFSNNLYFQSNMSREETEERKLDLVKKKSNDTKEQVAKREKDSGNTSPPGGNKTPGEKRTNTSNPSTNPNLTLGFLAAAAFFGTGSVISHFTDIIEEGLPRDLTAILSDFLAASSGALAITSFFGPTKGDTNMIKNSSHFNLNFS